MKFTTDNLKVGDCIISERFKDNKSFGRTVSLKVVYLYGDLYNTDHHYGLCYFLTDGFVVLYKSLQEICDYLNNFEKTKDTFRPLLENEIVNLLSE